MSTVSFVVCSHNGRRTLERCIRSILDQVVAPAMSQHELIVVTNGCTDDSPTVVAQILESSRTHHGAFRLRHVDLPQPGKSRALEHGLDLATGDLIAIVDDDNYLPPEWVGKVTRRWVGARVPSILGTASRLPAKTAQELDVQITPYLRHFAVGHQRVAANGVGTVWGAGCVFSREVWLELRRRGFRFQLPGRVGGSLVAGEDSEFCSAACLLGFRIEVDNEIALEHDIASSRLTMPYLEKLLWSEGMATPVTGLYRLAMQHEGVATSDVIVHVLSEIFFCILKLLLISVIGKFRSDPVRARLRVQLYRGIIESGLRGLSQCPDLCAFVNDFVDGGKGRRRLMV